MALVQKRTFSDSSLTIVVSSRDEIQWMNN